MGVGGMARDSATFVKHTPRPARRQSAFSWLQFQIPANGFACIRRRLLTGFRHRVDVNVRDHFHASHVSSDRGRTRMFRDMIPAALPSAYADEARHARID